MYKYRVPYFTSKLKTFIEEQLAPSDYFLLIAFGDDNDDSGLYDIAYSLKAFVQNNEFNPFDEDERKSDIYGRAFDEWYDIFIESDILPMLKHIAYTRYIDRQNNYEIRQEAAKQILQLIKDNNKYGWTSSLDYTCKLIAKEFGVEVKDD